MRVAGPDVGAQLPGPHWRLLPLLILDADMMGLTFVCVGRYVGRIWAGKGEGALQ